MCEDEVLAASLADQPWIRLVIAEIGSNGVPEVLEGVRGPGEVDPCQRRMSHSGLRHRGARSRDQVDDAGWHARGLEDLHDHLGRELFGGGGLSDHGVPDDRGCCSEVATDVGEVEWAYGE